MPSRPNVLFLFFLFLLIPSPITAQEPQKVIDQYVKASGGSKALSKIQTLILEGALSISGSEKSGTYTFNTRLPNRYYSEILLGERHLIESYNGKSAWHQDASGEISTLLGPASIELEAAARYYNSYLLSIKKNKFALNFAGHSTIRGRDAIEIEITSPTGIHRHVFFDTQSHLIVKESASVAGIEQEILYDDYRAVVGVQLPYKMELHRGSDTYQIIVTRAAVNAQVGERVFDFPRKSQVQLPDLKALFKEIDDNQKTIDKLKENYAGTRSEDETEFDGSGKVKKRELRESNFFYLNGTEVSTLVKKDGKPLSDYEQKKENERVQKRIRELQERHDKKEAKREKAKEEGKEESDKDEPSIEVFLRTCQFVNPRRERYRGQDVLVFDFEPNPDFKPRKLEERVAHVLAGVVWVDEKAHSVARLEAYFVGDFKMVGGLLINLQKGTSFVFEQSFINDEVWLPTYMEAHIGVRVLFAKKFRVSSVTRYSDYRKFNVESLSYVSAPKPK